MADRNFNRDLTLTRPEFWAIATSKGLGFTSICEVTRLDWNNFYRNNKAKGSSPTRHWLAAIAQIEGWLDAEGNLI